MVEVQAVRAGADPVERLGAEERSHPRSAVRHGGDHQHGGEVDGEETTTEQPRVGAAVDLHVEEPGEGAEGTEPDHGDEVEEWALVAHRATHHRHRAPQHGEGGTEQESGGAGERRQIEGVHLRHRVAEHRPVRLRRDLGRADLARVVEQRGRHGDDDGGEDEPPADLGQAAAAEAHQGEHDDRPEEVELLLDGEAPQVPQRGEVEQCGVPGARPDLVPVGPVADAGDDVAAQLAERVALEDRRVDHQQREHQEQRR